MTTKTKVKVGIAAIVLSVVMTVIAITGICLSLNKTYTFKGKIAFISSDIQATITKASISGGDLANNDKMQQIEVDGLITETESLKTWEDLDFKLSKDSKNIEIRFNIINHSTNKTLKINVGDISANIDNAFVDVRFEGMDSSVKTAYVARAKTDQQGDVVEEFFKQVIVTLQVNKKYKDASVTDLNIPISIQSLDAYVIKVTNLSAESDSNTMVYTDTNGNVQKLNQTIEVCGNTVTIINQTESAFEYKFILNNGTPTAYTIQAGMHIVFAVDQDSSIILANIVKVN